MKPKQAQDATGKKKQRDAGLFLRMLYLLSSMLNTMKSKVLGNKYFIEILNAAGTRAGIAARKGEKVIISFNTAITNKIRSFNQADQNKVADDMGQDSRRRRRKSSGSTSDVNPQEKADNFDWDAIPFVAFVKKQIERMLEAPKYVAQQGAHAGECFFAIVFKDGAMHIQLKAWAMGSEMTAKSGKKFFGNENWNQHPRMKGRTIAPFLAISHKEMNILLNEAANFHTTTRRDGKKNQGWKAKIASARTRKLQTYNAALAMAGILMYSENGSKMKIKEQEFPIAIFVQGGSTNRKTPVLGKLVGKQVNGKLRYEMKPVKTREEFNAPYVYDRDEKQFVAKNGRNETLSGYNIIRLVQAKLQDDTIEFGEKNSATKKILSYFDAEPEQLTQDNDKSFKSKLKSQAMEYIFEETICGGGKNGKKPKTIAKQLRIKRETQSDETLGEALLGQSSAGMFWKLLFSLTAYSNQTSTKKLEEQMGVGALNPRYADGVPVKANRKGKEGWTERGLLSPTINWKAAAIGEKACAETCDCVLCTTAAVEDYTVIDAFMEVFNAAGAGKYISPALLTRRGFDELPQGISASKALLNDHDQNGKQQGLTDEIRSQQNRPSEFKPMAMVMDEWNQRNGCSFGANLISRPYNEDAEELGVERDAQGERTGFVSFVEIVAYPTHSGWIGDEENSS